MAHILIVDDERDMVTLVGAILKKAGHDIIPAYNGKECLSVLETKKPDLILMDVNMPEMDGYTTVNTLLADDDLRRIPVIVLTGRENMNETFSLSSNVVDFLTKPFDAAQLKERVQSILDRRVAP